MIDLAANLLLNKYVLGALAIAALLFGFWLYVWNPYVAEPYREQGRAQMKAEMLPIIEAQSKRLDADIAAFKEIEINFRKISENSERLKKQAAQAQKIKVIREQVEVARIEYIDRIAPSGETECQRMDDVISKALR